MQALGGLVCLAVPLALGFAIWASLSWVLGPLNRAAENREFPIQFGLADLLCLFVLVQLPVGVVHWLIHLARELPVGALTMDVALMVITALLWLACVRLLSRAGVETVWHRCVVLAVVLPCTIAGPIAVLSFLFAAFALVMEKELATAVLAILVEMAVVGILYGLGRFTRAIVASAKETPPGQENREET
jgi:hypothetical protein